MTTLLDLCAWARSLTLEDAPEAVRTALALQVRSTLGAAGHGRHAPEVQAIGDLAATRPGPWLPAPGADPCDIEGALVAAAAMVGAAGNDDWLPTARPGPAIYAAWLIGAELDCSWDDVLAVQLAINEVVGRLGGATLPGVREGRSRVWLHACGSALAASLLLGLSDEHTAHAVAAAIGSASAPRMSVETESAHAIAVGDAVLSGRRCALLASRGLKGPTDGFDPDADFLRRLAGGRPLRGWFGGLGTSWLTDGLMFGVLPGGPLMSCALEAVLAIQAEARENEEPFRHEDIARVDIEASVLTCAQARPWAAVPATPEPGFLRRSLTGAVATILETEKWDVDTLFSTRPAENADERIHLHHEWALSLHVWETLKEARGEGLFEGLGPRGVVGLIAGRTGGMGWMELPFALAAERLPVGLPELQDELVDDPGAFLARGVQAAADWAAKRMEKLFLGPPLPGQEDLGETEEDATEEDGGWATLALPSPARVRVLLHDGLVREAERTHPLGSPARPLEETAEAIAAKYKSGAGRTPGLADDPTVLPEGTVRAAFGGE